MQSPKAKLDQSSSKQAIEAFALFMNMYPTSPEFVEAQSYIDELHNKLAYKAYLNAKLYFDLGSYLGNNYQSAIITAENCIKDFPGNTHSEELSFLILESRFIIAENSIEEKKQKRLRDVVDEYYSFLNEYPESEMKKKADAIFEKANKHLN